MTPNETPFFDGSDCPTGCCPRFNAKGWDEAEMHFDKKPFVRATTTSIAHVPLNMGRVFTRVQKALDDSGKQDPARTLVLSRDLSAFSGEHLFAATGPVEGEEMVTLSGDFLTKVFEGPYSKVGGWIGEMETLARTRGHRPGPVWFFYTTCPKCQKVYGKNPVVGVVELES